ncbi:hypothetical protein B484DRAFT_410763, partial [Ochromonadaceae sp. CCMP2298]
MQGSFHQLTVGAGPRRLKPKVFKKGHSIANLLPPRALAPQGQGQGQGHGQSADLYEYDAAVEGQLGM